MATPDDVVREAVALLNEQAGSPTAPPRDWGDLAEAP